MIYLFFIVGLFFGSFFAVVGDRWSNDQSIIKPGSHCYNCKKQLSWYELIPVFSYLFSKGRCRSCGDKLSIFYPITELLTGILFAFSYYVCGFTPQLIIGLALSTFLIITIVSDFKYMVILDTPLMITISIVLLTTLITVGFKDFILAILYGVIMFGFLFGVKFLGDKKFKRESLGGGDVKIMFLFGCTLGLQMSFICLVISSLLTYPFALYFVAKKKELEIPFGPFLIGGLLISFLYYGQISGFINGLFS